MPLKACAYRKKGDECFCLAELNAAQFVRGECGTNTRAYLVQVSDGRGTCLVEKPAKGGLCLVTAPQSFCTWRRRQASTKLDMR